MPQIQFTQYLRPYGIPRTVFIERPAPIVEKATALMRANCHLSIEELQDKTVVMTVDEEDADVPLTSRRCHNGPDVPGKVDELIIEAYDRLIIKQEPRP